LSIQIDNRHPAFVYEYFRAGTVHGNQKSRSFDDRRKMRRLDFEASLWRTLHVISQTAFVLTDPDAVAFGFGQREPARTSRRQFVTRTRQLEATAIEGQHLAAWRNPRAGKRLVPKGLIGGSERNGTSLPSDRPFGHRIDRAR
jgi:hypothetical protein